MTALGSWREFVMDLALDVRVHLFVLVGYFVWYLYRRDNWKGGL